MMMMMMMGGDGGGPFSYPKQECRSNNPCNLVGVVLMHKPKHKTSRPTSFGLGFQKDDNLMLTLSQGL